MNDDLERLLQQHGILTCSVDTLPTATSTPAYQLAVPSAECAQWWRQLRPLVPITGYWPVLLGDHDAGFELAQATVQEREAAPETNDIRHWFAQRAGQAAYPDRSWFTRQLYDPEAIQQAQLYLHGHVVDENDLFADVAFAMPTTRYDVHTPLQHRLGRVWIGLLPTTVSWMTVVQRPGPAVVDAVMHAGVIRRWEEQFGAEVVTITHDAIQLYATRPPADSYTALVLAWEQLAYAPDLETTLHLRALEIAQNPLWTFWWD